MTSCTYRSYDPKQIKARRYKGSREEPNQHCNKEGLDEAPPCRFLRQRIGGSNDIVSSALMTTQIWWWWWTRTSRRWRGHRLLIGFARCRIFVRNDHERRRDRVERKVSE